MFGHFPFFKGTALFFAKAKEKRPVYPQKKQKLKSNDNSVIVAVEL